MDYMLKMAHTNYSISGKSISRSFNNLYYNRSYLVLLISNRLKEIKTST